MLKKWKVTYFNNSMLEEQIIESYNTYNLFNDIQSMGIFLDNVIKVELIPELQN